jgi:curved DNA-binding protein
VDFKDYYTTLGTTKDASDKEIKQAYRKLARKLHPDVNPGNKSAESRFKDINEAYEVLGDPDKRRKYDELGANWRQYEQGQQQGGAPFDFSSFYTSPAQGGSGVHTMTEDEVRAAFGGGADPFSEFFHQFFGGSPDGGTKPKAERGARTRRGHDIEHELELSLEEAYSGATRRLSIKQGSHARSVDVRIPPGVSEGSRVRVPGEGTHGPAGARAGDLYLRIRLLPHERFERKDRDLYAHVSIPVTVAVLGGEAEVQGIDNRALRLKVPVTTQSGQVFRLKGHGMPAVGKADNRGDLYVTADIRLPRRLSAEQQRLFEELARLEDGATTPGTGV